MNVFILANIWSWAIPLAIALIFILWAGGVYNALVRLRNFYENDRVSKLLVVYGQI